MSRTLKTTLMWHNSVGSEVECAVLVEYDVDPGYAGDRIDPPQEASVEIIGVTPVIPEYDIPENAIDRDVLAEECMQDWSDDLIAAEEYKAEARAEDRRIAGWDA
jgi:hypothetical protein